MYAHVQGVTQDYKEAVKWYRLAADQGNAMAQYNLGATYANGQGVTQDYKEAVKWYRLSADQGTALAQSNLGVMYDKGQGVIQDYKEALKLWLFRKSCGCFWQLQSAGSMHVSTLSRRYS
jgi:TPR repeat protein